MEEFKQLLLGPLNLPTWSAAFIFALIGMFIYYHKDVKKRDKTSINTPLSFKFGFFTQDNIVSILFSLLTIFMSLRFSSELTGTKMTMLLAFGAGYAAPLGVSGLFKIQDNARKN